MFLRKYDMSLKIQWIIFDINDTYWFYNTMCIIK